MSTLHTINKSPFSHNTLSSCLGICAQNDGVLLIEDGVYAALAEAPCAEQLRQLQQRGITVYALRDDVMARGLSERLEPGINLTDYQGFVRLTQTHRCVQSWY